MKLNKTLIAAVAAFCLPHLVNAQDATGSVTMSMTVDPAPSGCTVADPQISLGAITMGSTDIVTSAFTPLEVHCFGATTAATVKITLGGTATATRAALAGPSSSVIPYALTATASNITMDGVPGTQSADLLGWMTTTNNPADGSGAAVMYSQNLRDTAYPGHAEAQVLAAGAYTATATVEVTYN